MPTQGPSNCQETSLFVRRSWSAVTSGTLCADTPVFSLWFGYHDWGGYSGRPTRQGLDTSQPSELEPDPREVAALPLTGSTPQLSYSSGLGSVHVSVSRRQSNSRSNWHHRTEPAGSGSIEPPC